MILLNKLKTTVCINIFMFAVCSYADDEQKPKTNPDAIPPVISPDDPDVKLSVSDHIKILNAKKADHVTRGRDIFKEMLFHLEIGLVAVLMGLSFLLD